MNKVLKDSTKKVQSLLFVMTSMGTGGIQTALRNLIAEIATLPQFHITILLFDKTNLKPDDFPSNVSIADAGEIPRVIALSTRQILNKSFYLLINRLIAGFLAKYVSQKYAYKFLFRKIKIEHSWDVAISFAQTSAKSLYGGMNEFVLDCVCANKKIAFIHCDFVAMNLNNAYSLNVYNKFDRIALVSFSLKNMFDKAMPLLKNKTCVVYNCHDFKKIGSLSEENPVNYQTGCKNFISVSRISPEKGLSRVLPAISRLKDAGFKFVWTIVGGGNKKNVVAFNKMVKHLNIESFVHCVGNQDNPYRYMKNADMLLVPSYHEAAPMVFQEAELLHLPVLCTRTCSANELVEERQIGMVCDNTSQAIYEKMLNVLEGKILGTFSFSEIMSNDLAIKQFIDILQ